MTLKQGQAPKEPYVIRIRKSIKGLRHIKDEKKNPTNNQINAVYYA
jgi:hypothetical protein